MKVFFLTILMFYFVQVTYSQPCYDDFILSIENQYTKKHSRFDKIASKVLAAQSDGDNAEINEYQYLHIPIITLKENKNTEIKRENLLCFLDDNLRFEWTIVLEDSVKKGLLLTLKMKVRYTTFFNQNSSFFISYEKLINELISINPDVVFEVYNIPQTFWIIKDHKLSILSYDIKYSRICDIQLVTVEDIINTFDQLHFELLIKTIHKIR